MRRALIIACFIFLADRALKIWVVDVLDLRRVYYLEVWDPFLNFTMAWNRGVNFGLFDFGEAGRWVLVGLALAVSVGLLVWSRRSRGPWTPLGTGLIVGGALGNAWDRVQWGAVADFLNMSCCGIHNPFAFNLADIAIFLGAILLVLVADRERALAPRKPRRKKA